MATTNPSRSPRRRRSPWLRRLVVVVHHDLRTAAEWFDRVALVDRRVVAAGRTIDTLTPENLQRTYAGHVDVLDELAQAIAARGRTP